MKSKPTEIIDRLLINRRAVRWSGGVIFILLLTVSVPCAFERSRRVDREVFADPPAEYRQQAWLTYNLSTATEENMTREVERWARKPIHRVNRLGGAPIHPLEILNRIEEVV